MLRLELGLFMGDWDIGIDLHWLWLLHLDWLLYLDRLLLLLWDLWELGGILRVLDLLFGLFSPSLALIRFNHFIGRLIVVLFGHFTSFEGGCHARKT